MNRISPNCPYIATLEYFMHWQPIKNSKILCTRTYQSKHSYQSYTAQHPSLPLFCHYSFCLGQSWRFPPIYIMKISLNFKLFSHQIMTYTGVRNCVDRTIIVKTVVDGDIKWLGVVSMSTWNCYEESVPLDQGKCHFLYLLTYITLIKIFIFFFLPNVLDLKFICKC